MSIIIIVQESTGKEVVHIRGGAISCNGKVVGTIKDYWQYADGTTIDDDIKKINKSIEDKLLKLYGLKQSDLDKVEPSVDIQYKEFIAMNVMGGNKDG